MKNRLGIAGLIVVTVVYFAMCRVYNAEHGNREQRAKAERAERLAHDPDLRPEYATKHWTNNRGDDDQQP